MGIGWGRKEERLVVELGRATAGRLKGGVGRIEVTFTRGPVAAEPHLDASLRPVAEYTEVHFWCATRKSQRPDADVEGGRTDGAWDEMAECFPGKADVVAAFRDLARRARFTGMMAGTIEQIELVEAHRDTFEPLHFHRDACAVLKEHGLYAVGEWRGPSGREEPRPYTYGAAWLHETVPADLEREILEAIADPERAADLYAARKAAEERDPEADAPSGPRM